MRNPDYLRDTHYRDSSRLRARIAFWDRFGEGGADRWTRWVFDRLEIPADANVLEIGCGTGGLWLGNADRVPAGWRITLSDLSEGMLAEARERLAAAGLAFDFTEANVQSLPFGDDRFDAIIANHMLYHDAVSRS